MHGSDGSGSYSDSTTTTVDEWVQKASHPAFISTEHAMEWGSHLNAEQHSALVKEQRALSYTAAAESNLQLKINLATQSQLMREAATVFALIWST